MDVLVLPTCRLDMTEAFLRAWRGVGHMDAVVIVEDAPLCTQLQLTSNDRHVCWADFEREAGDASWIFSRRDGGSQTFGWLIAARMGATRVHVLNDDCLPHLGIDPCAGHRSNLEGNIPLWRSSLPDLRTRGVPYGDVRPERTRALPVGLSMGLSAGVPDLDAVTSLAKGCPENYVPPSGVRALAPGVYEPFCDMNWATWTDMLPILYCPLQGEGQPCGRFDDIWAGVVAKRCLDHLNMLMTVGDPVIHHTRASDVYRNLQREAGGMGAHEYLWRLVDEAPLRDSTPEHVAAEMGEWLLRQSESFPMESFRGYVAQYGRALLIWSQLVQAEPVGGESWLQLVPQNEAHA